MIWATWRMNRSLYTVSVALAAAVAVWLALTGARQESAWVAFSALRCSYPGAPGACADAASRYYSASEFSTAGVAIGMVLPGLLGLVLGTPLVAAEIGQRTNRLGWTQSITRSRWLGQKLLVGGLATVVVAAALVPVLNWWTGAVQRPRMVPLNFDVSGVLPIAYALFAFALGTLLGALVQRTGWAFAIGVAVFAAVRFLERTYLRVLLVPPTFTTKSVFAPANVWVVNEGYVPLHRSTPAPGLTWQSGGEAVGRCAVTAAGFETKSYARCAATLKLHYVFEVQPASHYWPLQLAEAGVFLVGACVLFALTVVAVRRWRT